MRNVDAGAVVGAQDNPQRIRVSSLPMRRGDSIVGVQGLAVRLGGEPSREPDLDGRGGEPRLTRRQLDVLRLLADGLTTKEIATRPTLTENTVENHVRAVLRKLGARTRLEAVVRALRLGVIAPEPGT